MNAAVEIDLAKLRKLIVDTTGPGKKFTRRALSMAATEGRNPDLVRDLMRVDKRKPTIEAVAGICGVLGIPLSEVVKGVAPTLPDRTEWLKVGGSVAAGVWKEQTEWPRDDWYEIEVDSSDFEGDHFGLTVEGRSMERTLPPGTVLRCVDLIGSGVEIQDGDYVIVERKQGPLREVTCKRLRRQNGGDWELVAESYQPEFREPIVIGKPIDSDDGPNFDGIDEKEIRVKALVIDAYLPLARRRRRPAN